MVYVFSKSERRICLFCDESRSTDRSWLLLGYVERIGYRRFHVFHKSGAHVCENCWNKGIMCAMYCGSMLLHALTSAFYDGVDET